jgi:creatinine amidohydrolase
MYYGERKWPEMPGQTDKVVVLPLGSMEQHGHHLPLLTDTMNLQEVVRRAEIELGDEALFLPVLWVGLSEHHRGFPGTVSVPQETYVRLLVDLMECLIGNGFRRIVLLNGHGGNSTPGQAALYDVRMRHRKERDLWLVFATWFSLAAPEIAAIPELVQKRVSHASELETSMVLRLRPEWVDLDAARGTGDSPGSGRPSRVSAPRPFDQSTQTGALGHPERATPGKGESIFTVAAQQVVAAVREVAGWQVVEPR